MPKKLFARCCLTLCCLPLLLQTAALAALPDPMRFSVALERGDMPQAQAWLDAGLDPNFEGALIGTGLMIGAWEGNIPLMELFRARGADLQQVNRHGETALMLAAWRKQLPALEWLLAQGAAVNRPERHWSALHYAAFAGHRELVEPLLAAGADINARSTNGSTVLMMAAREGHEALAKRLLAAGANPVLKNDFADDAVSWAMRQGNYRIAEAFTSAENFAELARQAAAVPAPPPPQRSQPVPDVVEEHLRMARLAEASGQRDVALAAYRQALAELKRQEATQKVGAGQTANSKTPSALVIRAKRSAAPAAQQSLSFVYDGADESTIDDLLTQARAAEAAGDRAKAVRLFRQAAQQIKTTPDAAGGTSR
jgi:hypothetical protein